MKLILKFNWLIVIVLFTSFQINAQKQSMKILVKDSIQQKEFFKDKSEDIQLKRQFKNYVINKKNTTHIIGNQKMIIGNDMVMDSIDLKHNHGE